MSKAQGGPGRKWVPAEGASLGETAEGEAGARFFGSRNPAAPQRRTTHRAKMTGDDFMTHGDPRTSY